MQHMWEGMVCAEYFMALLETSHRLSGIVLLVEEQLPYPAIFCAVFLWKAWIGIKSGPIYHG